MSRFNEAVRRSPNGSATGHDEDSGDVEFQLVEEPGDEPTDDDVRWQGDGGSLEDTVDSLILHALTIGASDLFFACNEQDVDVSVRQLGIIKSIARLPAQVGHRCIGHIRAVSGLRHAEKRHPQDGRWIFRRAEADTVDIRISTLPTLYGEVVGLRLLVRNTQIQQLEGLGLMDIQLGTLLSLLHSPGGLILVTGPTGSGKTTTLYACLRYLNDGRRKIHTIEDPVEYAIPGLFQSQVDEISGADFPELLRGVVRQGPDVIMIGEVRDQATAETAVRAANSGHLVFATLHAPVAAAAVQSMLGLGVAPHFLASSLLAVMGQRLVRLLNPATRLPVDLSMAPRTFEEVSPWLDGEVVQQVYAAPNGDSSHSYIGQTGVFELMTMTPRLRQMINNVQPPAAIARTAVDQGMIDFRRAALLKVAEGLTSFDEMQRVLPSLQDFDWASESAPA